MAPQVSGALTAELYNLNIYATEGHFASHKDTLRGGNMLGTPRMLFAFARDGYLPSVLGRVHPRSRIPHVAILCYAALAIGLALSGTFAELAVLATLGSAAVYIAGCAAAWRLARRGVARAGVPLNYRWLREYNRC